MICKPNRMRWRAFNLHMDQAEQLAQQANHAAAMRFAARLGRLAVP